MMLEASQEMLIDLTKEGQETQQSAGWLAIELERKVDQLYAFF